MSKLETKTMRKARAVARNCEVRWKTMEGKPKPEWWVTAWVVRPALTCNVTAAPLLPPPLLLPRRRFHRDRRVTVSFLDRATSSRDIRIFCSASHIDCTVRVEDDQRHKFQLILEGRKILTGKYCPDDRQARDDTVSSAGGKTYKPV